MTALHEQFEQMMEELDDMRAYNGAKALKEEFVPFEQGLAEIQAGAGRTGPEGPVY